jgi:NTE family protein
VGSSAGAINATFLAAHASEPQSGVARLEELWSSIEPQHVFRTDLRSLGGIGVRWVRDLSFGGLLRRTGAQSLLDTAPLRELLLGAIPFDRIDDHVESGRVRALAMPATDLYTSDGVVFLDAQPDVPLWKRGRWRVERTRIGVDHVMASSAIPLFFPSVEIDGHHFGDGSVRNTAPLSPAINLGADRIVAVGVRQPTPVSQSPTRSKPPSIAQVAGTLLDAVMLDAIGVDVEHSERVNTSVMTAPSDLPDEAFRFIDALPDARPRYRRGDHRAGELPALRRGVLPASGRAGSARRDGPEREHPGLLRGLGPDPGLRHAAPQRLPRGARRLRTRAR